MTAYYDTGVLIKLYTEEPESEAVRKYVLRRNEALRINDLHLAEIASALALKKHRRECGATEIEAVFSHLEADRRNGVLVPVAIDWPEAWSQCQMLAKAQAAVTGCRTLDTLHVVCALLLRAKPFVTSDHGQASLARKTGLTVVNPFG